MLLTGNFGKKSISNILKKCFLGTTLIIMFYVAGSNLQPHSSVLPVFKRSIGNNNKLSMERGIDMIP